jgi:hypothetical protein
LYELEGKSFAFWGGLGGTDCRAVEQSEFDDLVKILQVNTTYIANDTARDEVRRELFQAQLDFVGNILTTAYSGILWLFPTAGLVLILSSLLFMVRHDHRGNKFRHLEFLHMVAGLALCLLGLLAVGNKRVQLALEHPQVLDEGDTSNDFNVTARPLAPLFSLVDNGLCLGIVAIVLSALWILDSVLLLYARRHHGRQSWVGHSHEKPILHSANSEGSPSTSFSASSSSASNAQGAASKEVREQVA